MVMFGSLDGYCSNCGNSRTWFTKQDSVTCSGCGRTYDDITMPNHERRVNSLCELWTGAPMDHVRERESHVPWLWRLALNYLHVVERL